MESNLVFRLGPKVLESEKMCEKIGRKWFGNLKTWTQTHTWKPPPPKKIQSVKTKIRGSLNYKELQSCHKGEEPLHNNIKHIFYIQYWIMYYLQHQHLNFILLCIRLICKVTLPSPCLWACFHRLIPLSVVSTK